MGFYIFNKGIATKAALKQMNSPEAKEALKGVEYINFNEAELELNSRQDKQRYLDRNKE
ncbi:MAG: hypothetical protein U9O94_06160 [Nanoarchaeota archaeon]|nr:hypothetical protein [Nanoarchaeota archaeon]